KIRRRADSRLRVPEALRVIVTAAAEVGVVRGAGAVLAIVRGLGVADLAQAGAGDAAVHAGVHQPFHARAFRAGEVHGDGAAVGDLDGGADQEGVFAAVGIVAYGAGVAGGRGLAVTA